MSTLQIAALAYALTTFIYLVPTYIEGERAGGQWSIYRVAGLVLCFFWPLLTVLFICKAVAGTSRPKFVFSDPAIPGQNSTANRSPD
ncbi:hypothetical protein LJR098_001795 [Rhizobium sp. LjRoot98]|uniref:hypothetical protein n=1 Tax=unclassified Rhizobium TaxID=2613769 RepID=UPI00071552BD|nr:MULTISPECIES: hypothetical protein [unclassified Rhizobium]KQV39048.1 hypothetical protein ASC96_24540 [Rhizobium sp. Root1204]KQY16077.1 hypothetical protein ASD36_24285 [Rhizobium sp. Root1334]KRC10250.1 hypothetical protein ASE23_24815 [Rhizobium sp. Root73]